METNAKKGNWFLASFVPSQVSFNSWKLKPGFQTRDRDPLPDCHVQLELNMAMENCPFKTGWWFQFLWKIWKSLGIIIPNWMGK